MTTTPAPDFTSLTREDFVKASFSGPNDNCMHLAPVHGGAALWESEEAFSPENFKFIPKASLAAFVDGAKAGEFDHLC